MKLIKRIWKWSPLVTLPIVIVFGMWASATYKRWHQFDVRLHTSTDLPLLKIGALEANHLKAKVRTGVTASTRRDRLADAGIRTVQLFIADKDLNRLDSNIPHTAFDYVEGALLQNGELQDVDLRYRGDNVYHWGYWKKSWRVKTKRSQLFDGMRKFNLVAPRTTDVVNNHLASLVASKMGLIAPKSELVNVAVNGRVSGLFILTEQIDESTIRRHGRMPGDVYSGELISRDGFRGIDNNLFDSPYLWNKVAINNHFEETSLAPLEGLLDAVRQADEPGGHERLLELIDLDAFATFSAFESVAGTVHTNDLHNWRIYYDPFDTCFKPVVWDPVGWHRSIWPSRWTPYREDTISSQLHIALHRNGEFLARKSAKVQEFFDTGLDEYTVETMDECIAQILPILDIDPNFVEEGVLKSPREVAVALTEFRDYIASHLRKLESYHRGEAAELSHARIDDSTVRLRMHGGRVLQDLQLRFQVPVTTAASATVRWTEGGVEREADIAGAVAVGAGAGLTIQTSLIGDLHFKYEKGILAMGHRAGLLLDDAEFDIVLANLPAGADVVGLSATVDGTRRESREVAAWEGRRSMTPMVDRVVPVPVEEVTVYEGVETIAGIHVIEGPVIIRPGTRFEMEPDANLLFHGLVQAQGTDEAPILFVPAGDQGIDTAWGVVALKGHGCDGSTFRHCEFRGGSGLKRPLYEYSAMFSVHAARAVTVEYCLFEDSYVVDDMVHAVYSDIYFGSCTWKRSLSDALDVDISRTVIEDCQFEASGNDAIDLMTTDATVVRTTIANSGDKGISIGEASRLRAVACQVIGCEIGLQSKDDSYALAINCELTACKMGVDAYKKNWRYDGGGTIIVMDSIVKDCESSLSADADSTVGMDDSYVGGKFGAFDFGKGKKAKKLARRILFHETDANAERKTTSKQRYRFQDKDCETLFDEIQAGWQAATNPEVRGRPAETPGR